MKSLIYKEGLLVREPIGITNGSLTLTKCTLDHARKGVVKHHYSRKVSRNSFLSFAVNKTEGFIQLGYGMNPTKKSTISKLITLDNHCEFDRMWLSDALPKFSESQVISLLLSYIKQVHPNIQFIITYADEAMGNTGIIYQATNALSLGKHKTHFYILPNGERTHAVSLWHKYKTSSKEFLKEKGIKAEVTWQHRYLYILNKGMRKKYQEEIRHLPDEREGSIPSFRSKNSGGRRPRRRTK
tara:strand:- start:72 stop:794 length:723 start_codon:yes stop_codon:yes gene_type:complete